VPRWSAAGPGSRPAPVEPGGRPSGRGAPNPGPPSKKSSQGRSASALRPRPPHGRRPRSAGPPDGRGPAERRRHGRSGWCRLAEADHDPTLPSREYGHRHGYPGCQHGRTPGPAGGPPPPGAGRQDQPGRRRGQASSRCTAPTRVGLPGGLAAPAAQARRPSRTRCTPTVPWCGCSACGGPVRGARDLAPVIQPPAPIRSPSGCGASSRGRAGRRHRAGRGGLAPGRGEATLRALSARGSATGAELSRTSRGCAPDRAGRG